MPEVVVFGCERGPRCWGVSWVQKRSLENRGAAGETVDCGLCHDRFEVKIVKPRARERFKYKVVVKESEWNRLKGQVVAALDRLLGLGG